MRVIVITERLADVAHSVDATTAALCVTLAPDDASRRHLGHAPVAVANPVARRDGVAVVVGEESLPGVPDPLRIVVTTGRGARGLSDGVLTVRRSTLPVLVELGERPTVRRIAPC